LAVTVFAGYLLVKRTDAPVGDNSSETTREGATQESVAESPKSLARMTSNEKVLDPAADHQHTLADCISPAQLASDPVLAEEYARLDSIVTSGPAIQSYRGLSSAQLGDLAIQGDSAAMAVLGAVSVMRARNLPEDKAVAYLLREDPSLWSFSLAQRLEPETVKHLEEARDWFYKSALHGRLLALQNAGEIIGIVAGTPTKLGWIEEDEYESLEGYERHALDPTTVYHALAFEIAPQLRTGPFGTIISELAPGGERQQAVLDELASQFEKDREAAKLPPIVISASTAPSMEEFESMLCEPYLDSVP
jgi:hypothetical protein